MRTRRRLLGSKASFQKGPHLVCEAKIAFHIQRFNRFSDYDGGNSLEFEVNIMNSQFPFLVCQLKNFDHALNTRLLQLCSLSSGNVAKKKTE